MKTIRRNPLAGVALVCALLPACSSEAVEMPPAAPVHFRSLKGGLLESSPPTPTGKERGLAGAYIKALASPGFNELSPVVDQDVHMAIGARDIRGRKQVIKSHDDVFGAFDERRFVASRVFLTDSSHTLNSQAVEWTMTGQHARDWMGIAPTHKPVAIKGLTLLWTNDDGIVSDMHVYFDEEVVKAQLGSGPAELQKLPIPEPPSGAPQLLERGGTKEETASIGTVRAMLKALEENNEKDFLSTMTDDVDVFTLDRAESARGTENARAYFKTLRKSIRQLDTVVQNAWGVQSFVILEYGITGVQTAPMRRLAIRTDGGLNTLRTQFVDIAELRDGKIARIWRYADPAAFGSL